MICQITFPVIFFYQFHVACDDLGRYLRPFDDDNSVDNFVGKVSQLCTDEMYDHLILSEALARLLDKLHGLYYDSLLSEKGKLVSG